MVTTAQIRATTEARSGTQYGVLGPKAHAVWDPNGWEDRTRRITGTAAAADAQGGRGRGRGRRRPPPADRGLARARRPRVGVGAGAGGGKLPSALKKDARAGARRGGGARRRRRRRAVRGREDDDDEEEDEAEDPAEFDRAVRVAVLVGRPARGRARAQRPAERLHWYLRARCGGAAVAEVMPPRTVTADNRCNARALYARLRALRVDATKEEATRDDAARDSRRAAAAAAAALAAGAPAEPVFTVEAFETLLAFDRDGNGEVDLFELMQDQAARRTMAVRFKPPKSRRRDRGRARRREGRRRERPAGAAAAAQGPTLARGRLARGQPLGDAARARLRRRAEETARAFGAAASGATPASPTARRTAAAAGSDDASDATLLSALDDGSVGARSLASSIGSRRCTHDAREAARALPAVRGVAPTRRRALRALGARPHAIPGHELDARVRELARRGRRRAARAARLAGAGGGGGGRRRAAARGDESGSAQRAEAAASLLAVERVVRFRKCMALTDFVRHVARDVDPERKG